LGGDLQVYLHREPIDFRAGINSLAVLVQETMALDPFTPAVFAFCNRRCDRMKLLFFDRSGFVLVLKRLTEDKFRWPRRQEAVAGLRPSNCTGFLMASISMRWSAIRCGNIRLPAELSS
ncbi:IS66 family insertion sequence element accessory protein TnpB, partial [Bradyrhizobium elkanii]|uniref:IS66 family insertion sequence element accessory protein TnpB n=1 Tax=Bradyrhizobium elkanii TaxID=29448 RepID=UPI001476D06A